MTQEPAKVSVKLDASGTVTPPAANGRTPMDNPSSDPRTLSPHMHKMTYAQFLASRGKRR